MIEVCPKILDTDDGATWFPLSLKKVRPSLNNLGVLLSLNNDRE